MSEVDKTTRFDYSEFEGYYSIERSYFCEKDQRRKWVSISPDAILTVVQAVEAIKLREEIGGYGHEGIPDLLKALAALES